MAFRRGAVALSVLLSLVALALPASAKQPPDPELLQKVVDRLALLAPNFGSTGIVSVTVSRLDTQASAAFQGDELVKAASVTKALWMAAAIDHSGVSTVEYLANSVLYQSSNETAGRAIDLAGGIDSVNRFAADVGLTDTVVYEWGFGYNRRSRLYPGPLRGLNTTTTNEQVAFWEMLAKGWLLPSDQRTALLQWTMGYKQELEGQRLVQRLPEAVAEGSSFKMGWLPVGRSYDLEDDETGWNGEPGGETVILVGGAVDIGSGIIRVPGGPSYIISISAYNGRSWGGMTSWVEYGSCVIYSVIAEDHISCVRRNDPARIVTRVAEPSGELLRVDTYRGFLTLGGWAMDPDAWWGSTAIEVQVDGARVGTLAARPTGTADLMNPQFGRMLPYEAEPGHHQVCAIALNDGAGPDTPIGCVAVVIPG